MGQLLPSYGMSGGEGELIGVADVGCELVQVQVISHGDRRHILKMFRQTRSLRPQQTTEYTHRMLCKL